MAGMHADPNLGDAATSAKARLRVDLKLAMQTRALLRVRTLRSLIAALDNAEAVPPAGRHERYVVHAFGDRSAEVPRLTLTQHEVGELFEREAAARRADAANLAALGKLVQANDLQAEASIIDAYVPGIDRTTKS